MTTEEHIVAWIESSAPHYAVLLKLSREGGGAVGRAVTALGLATRAYTEMVRTGDAWDHGTSEELCKAAGMLCAWEEPE